MMYTTEWNEMFHEHACIKEFKINVIQLKYMEYSLDQSNN